METEAQEAVVLRESPAIEIKPKMTPAILKEMDGYINDLIVNGLVEGVDYGTEKGIETPFLKKPGAEKLCLAYGLRPDFDVMDKTVDHEFENTYYSKKWKKEFTTKGLYAYEIKCRLLDEYGNLRASGVGSASSLESKYCYNPKDVQNTLFKMAKKRAFVDATCTAFALSNRFTQDLEDITANQAEATKSVEKKEFEKPKADVYEHGNTEQMDRLGILLDKCGRKLTGENRIAISERMHGKPMIKKVVDNVINAVMEGR